MKLNINLKMVMASMVLAFYGLQSYAQDYMNAKEVTVLKGIAVEGVDTAGVHQDPTCPEVLLETTMGNIRIALYNDTPLHRDNFLKWVNCGYYNGCIFHRVIKNFMVQAGDPATRKVDPLKKEVFDTAYVVPAEIRYPKYYHKRGQLCAAREGDEENPKFASAPCDFYITWGRNFSRRQIEYLIEKEAREEKAYVLPNKQVIDGYVKYGGVPHLDGGLHEVLGQRIHHAHLFQEILHFSLHSHLLQLSKFESHVLVETRHYFIRHRNQQVFHRLGPDTQACSQQASHHYIFHLLHFYNSFDHFFPQGVKSHARKANATIEHTAKVKANVFIFEAYIF